MDRFHLEAPQSEDAADVLFALEVEPKAGLSNSEAKQRLSVCGANEMQSRPRAEILSILLHQFQSPAVILLAIAVVVALALREWEEGVSIIVVLVINAVIGFATEFKAIRSIEAIRALASRSSRVLRDGEVCVIQAKELVPGDIVLLDAGDVIPADLRLIETANLEADESTLTGESVQIGKTTTPVRADARLADRTSIAFQGTNIVHGTGVGVVVATGTNTELGQISKLVADAKTETSPLEKKLARLSGQLIWLTLVLATLTAGLGLLQGKDPFLMIEAAIALAVAAIPEGLPIVATLALARGMWRMAQKNALVERLAAVETLGATTVILTDKTGTLTENRMTVQRIWLPSGEVRLATNSFGSSEGSNVIPPGAAAEMQEALEVAVLCNNATLSDVVGGDSGDPMELALLRAGRMAGLDRRRLLHDNAEVSELAFNIERKMMATIHRHGEDYIVAVKGAPEAVLASVILDEPMRREWLARAAALGTQGLRVLGIAKKTARCGADFSFDASKFLGLVGLDDPPRPDVPAAIGACRDAGIKVIMVTGDHAATARSIAGQVGLGGETPRITAGTQLTRHNESIDTELLKSDIFARVSPTEKLELVRLFQASGQIVAMTGDGVNDAPALRQADIGVAMGLRGTDVAREAAAMILLDDAFPTIVEAIRNGRVIFDNIRRFAIYLLSCNLAEVLTVGIAMISGLPLPLLPIQILFLNLVTDVFPAFALAMGEGDRDVLKRPPRSPKEPLLGRAQWIEISLHGAFLTMATFGALAAARYGLLLSETETVTVAFLTLAFSQLWHVFNMRDRRSSAVDNDVSRNPWLWGALALCAGIILVSVYSPYFARMLHVSPPGADAWVVISTMSVLPLIGGPLIARLSVWLKRYGRQPRSQMSPDAAPL
ncbi:cation-translocating P-type ATPase [Tardiphaga sp. 71_E8_N1_1]|uniref:cation-translocating P-type ATPase n=1 Tax=Tardiphaga sp. 71_E8_N1_1 TaxID=3240784 RepID=UPI003F8AD214